MSRQTLRLADHPAQDRPAGLTDGADFTAAPEVCARYRHDRGSRPGAPPRAVLKPAAVEDIAAGVAWAAERRWPVLARGLSTTAHGQALFDRGGLLIDLAQFNRVGPLDPAAATITVQAGAAWADVDAYLNRQGFTLYTYPTSRFSTAGGWVATGGVGVNAFGYGHLQRWVAALRVVTPEGEQRTLAPDDALFSAYFGAEGRAGAVAEVALRVRPAPRITRAHLFYFDSTRAQVSFVELLINARTHLAHLALYNQGHMAYRNRLYAEAHPHRTPFYGERPAVLVHVESDAEAEALEDALARADFLVDEAVPYAAATLWRQRFYPLAIQRFGPDLLTAPVVAPLAYTEDLIDEIAGLAERFGLTPDIETTVVQVPQADYTDYDVLVMPRFPYDVRSPARPFHAVLANLITREAVLRGGRPYVTGRANAAFDPASQPRLKYWFFRASLGTARAFAGQVGHLARARHRPADPPALPRPNQTAPLDDAELAATIGACTGCANCVPVCPAFLLTRDEASTGRAKLQTGALLLAGLPVDAERAAATFMCTYCGACRDVCETELPLLAAYAAIEAKLDALHGRPEARIAAFVEAVETDEAYRRFAGAPPRPTARDPIAPAPPANPDAAPRREHIGPYSVIRSIDCINCGRCVHACAYGVHARRDDDPRRMARPAGHRCVACMRCVQICPTRALTVTAADAYNRLGRGIYTPDIVSQTAQAAGTGDAPPSSNAWLDSSGLAYPSLPVEVVETRVTLGRRLERLNFDAGSNLASLMPPMVTLDAPLILALPAGAPDALNEALVQAARTLGVLALAPEGVDDGEHRASVAVRLPAGGSPDEVGTPGLLVVEGSADVVARLRTHHPGQALAAEIALDDRAPDIVLELVGRGVDVALLRGGDGIDGETDVWARLPAVHRALAAAVRRDRVSLVVWGAVATAGDLARAMLLGADAAVIDWPLLLALECRLQSGCAEGEHVCGIDGVPAGWAVARMVNLVRAWQGQLKTWLAALGLHRIHQLRDARNRLAFGDAASFAGLADLRMLSGADLSPDQVLGD